MAEGKKLEDTILTTFEEIANRHEDFAGVTADPDEEGYKLVWTGQERFSTERSEKRC
jgi:hypothetical protein